MNLLVDTNRYRDYCDGVIETLEVFRSAASISFPFIVLGELRAGFVWGQKAEENEARLMGLLHSERVRTLYPDDQTTHHYARLYNQLRTQGTPNPIYYNTPQRSRTWQAEADRDVARYKEHVFYGKWIDQPSLAPATFQKLLQTNRERSP